MKKKETSTQSLTNSSETSGLLLKEYKEQIGEREYQHQYSSIYYLTKYRYEHDIRCSHSKYRNDENKINEIKEKYKNGVTDEILKEWLF